MRDRLNAPLIFDRSLGGCRFETTGQRIGPQYEQPGLWFTAEEIHALLTMQQLLSNLDTGGLLGPQIQHLLARLSGLLGIADNPAEEVQCHVHIPTVGTREFHLEHFQAVGSALLRRKRLIISYHARGTDEVIEREFSPQRPKHYRDNWCLDAWCHLRDGLRTFAVDAIEPVADRGSWAKCFLSPDDDRVGSRLLLPRQRVPNILTGIIPAQPLDHPSRRFPDLADNRRTLTDR